MLFIHCEMNQSQLQYLNFGCVAFVRNRGSCEEMILLLEEENRNINSMRNCASVAQSLIFTHLQNS